MQSSFRHTAETIRRDIESTLYKVGILCRVFARGKDDISLKEKLTKEPGKYVSGGKLVQDIIGVRVVLYFEEDIPIVEQLLSAGFSVDSEASTIDRLTTDQFSVTRHNLICRMPTAYNEEMKRNIGSRPIDMTFEVQLRSVLSEGWHEVDHDLRYKSKNSWSGHDDLSRALNGILATLETSEWSMKRIFDDLAYRHYKQRNWASMLHTKVRMRARPELSSPLVDALNADQDLAKEVFRINRTSVIHQFARLSPSIPISLDNIVFIWNQIETKNEVVTKITPTLIVEAMGTGVAA